MTIHATLAGRIGRDAETRQAGQTTATGFSVATDHGFGDRKQTLWVDCTLWGTRGERLASHLTKGSGVIVSGPLYTHEHNGKTYLKLDVREFEFAPTNSADRDQGGGSYGGGRTERQSYGEQSGGQRPGGYGQTSGGTGGGDDDIPF